VRNGSAVTFTITALDGESQLLAIPAIRRWLSDPPEENGPALDGTRRPKSKAVFFLIGPDQRGVLVWGSINRVWAEVQEGIAKADKNSRLQPAPQDL
jgi:hypothetical protein